MNIRVTAVIAILLSIMLTGAASIYCQDDDTTRSVLKNGLLGAGTGAIAAGASVFLWS